MASLLDEAQGYSPKQTKNIADMEVVPVTLEVQEETEVEFPYKYIMYQGERHRVPNTVLEQLQAILKEKPGLVAFKVTKKGEGLKTTYTVIPLD